MEKMKQDIARIQNATDVARPPSIDRRQPLIDRQQTITIDRQTPSRIDRQPLGRIDRHQSATPTDNEVSTRFPHQRRGRSVGRRDL
ncbi:hypothetical protein DY000_02060230 [Brassica cretica]|uniref:Uncharacterized protein n=1 Tax=Brassica cretica TaxID=69181 RepID=A0ABQ7AY41_BRACR|nr:hypothetical protein DY000_02060230 [Brassica cretica]